MLLNSFKNSYVCFLQEEDEVPDDETINQMLARSEDEFNIYQVCKSAPFLSLELFSCMEAVRGTPSYVLGDIRSTVI